MMKEEIGMVAVMMQLPTEGLPNSDFPNSQLKKIIYTQPRNKERKYLLETLETSLPYPVKKQNKTKTE